MTDRLLAVDLGKTHCRAELRHGGRTMAASGPGAPGLAAPDGAAQAEAAIRTVAKPLLQAAGLQRLDRVGVAAAGALTAPAAAQALAERLCAILAATEVTVCSDAVAAHAGALGGAAGVVLAIGTGAVAIAVTPDGRVHRADGLGPWLGDAGGGAWLGLRGLRAALVDRQGRGPATALQAAAARFEPLADLPGLIEGHPNPARLAAGFAPDVAAAAAEGDVVAASLMRRAVAALAATVAHAARHFGEADPVAFAITGGLVSLGPMLMTPLLEALPTRLRVQPTQGTPLDGAALLARGEAPIHAPSLHRTQAGAAPPLNRLTTEAVRPGLDDLDLRPPSAIIDLVLQIEGEAHAALLRAAPQLGAAAEAVAARMRAGGRLFYLGAGTPGRLATLDAAELAPTFSAPPGLVIPLLAGGPDAMREAVEGAEDDPDAAALALAAYALTPGDAVVGIAASGRTPFVLGGLRVARATGALTIAIVNNPGSPIAAEAEIPVEILTGPELVAGSTRMSAGTTQKIALNALSTAAMIALGKTYGARMVDVRASNAKLRRRAIQMVQDITGASAEAAEAALLAAQFRVKPALVTLLAGVGAGEAARLLDTAGGNLRTALAGARS